MSGCWLWISSYHKRGYGTLFMKGSKAAQRISCILHYGPIPSDMHVLHKCDVKGCVNPWHLFLGTNQDNVNDKMNKSRHHRQRTSNCVHNHPLSGDNLYLYKGVRHCRTCQKGRERRYKAKLKTTSASHQA
jgi:hypothetical protein